MPPRSAAVLLWSALLSGVAVTTGLCVFLRPRFASAPPQVGASTLVVVSLAFAALAASAVLPLLRRIESRAPSEDVAVWWVRMLPKALAVWAVADAVGLAGAVAFLVTGQAVLFAATAVSLAIFLFANPARLPER